MGVIFREIHGWQFALSENIAIYTSSNVRKLGDTLKISINREVHHTQEKLTGPSNLQKWDPSILSLICRLDMLLQMQNFGLTNKTNQ
jgi:hypothetical protein